METQNQTADQQTPSGSQATSDAQGANTQSIETQSPENKSAQQVNTQEPGTAPQSSVNEEGAIPPSAVTEGPAQYGEGSTHPEKYDTDLTKPAYAVKSPTIGRFVVFFPNKDDQFARVDDVESNAALVVKVLDNNQVNIRVFNVSDEAPRVYKNVPHKSNVDESNPVEHYWDWPEIK